MPEVRLIDKKRTEAKVFLIARHFIDRPDREVELVRAVIHRCCEEIDKQPTIEAEPVRHGRWKGWTTSKFTGKYKDYDEPEFKDYVYYTCSECYRKSAIQELYCPNCGARMDGGADNVD